jgi:hypothetical protein
MRIMDSYASEAACLWISEQARDYLLERRHRDFIRIRGKGEKRVRQYLPSGGVVLS